jgi:hypothetical protein
VWETVDKSGVVLEPGPTTKRLIVWRGEGTLVYQHSVEGVEAELISLLVDCTDFGALCERLCTGRADDEATRLGFELLSRWVADGLLVEDDGLPGEARL